MCLSEVREEFVASFLTISCVPDPFIDFDCHDVTAIGAPPAHHYAAFMPPPVSSDLLVEAFDGEYLI
ncbi:MAG: hypothetical protein U0105_10875 [Candidatus Obscuribacterales bacterium]